MNADLAASHTRRVTRKRQQRAEAKKPMGWGARAPKAPAPDRTPKKPPVLFKSAPTTTSLTRQTQQRARRAAAAMPRQAQPNIPVIRNPSRQQLRAAGDAIRRQEATATRGKKGAAYNAAVAQNERELAGDPRNAAFLKARAHYLKASTQLLNERAGRDIARQTQRRVTAAQARRIGAQAATRNPRARTLTSKPGTMKVGPASIPVTAASKVALAALGLDRGPGVAVRQFIGRVGSRTAKDAGTLVTSPIIAGVEFGKGTSDLVRHGDSRRLKRLAAGTLEGIAHSAPGELVRAPFSDEASVRKAGEQLIQHPLLEAVNILGGLQTGGVVAGTGARALGRLGVEKAARAGDRRLSPIVDREGNVVRERRASRDILRAGAQRTKDKRRETHTDDQGNTPTYDVRGKEMVGLRSTGREERRLQRRAANFDANRANASERAGREEEAAAATVAGGTRMDRVRGRGVSGKAARDLVAMAAEGTIRTGRSLRSDLQKQRDVLADNLQRHHRGEEVFPNEQDAARALEQVKFIDDALSKPRVMDQAEKIVAEAEEHGRARNVKEQELIDKGVLDAAQAKRRRLMPTAIRHMGARHYTVQDHARVEREAKKVEADLRAQVEAAPGPEKEALRAKLRDATEHRIAVSGKNPAAVRQYERAIVAQGQARNRITRAEKEIARTQSALDRLAGRHAAKREDGKAEGRVYYVGAKPFEGPRALERAKAESKRRGVPWVMRARGKTEAELLGKRTQLQRRLKAAKDDRTAAQRVLSNVEPFARHEPKANAALRYADGRHLPDKDIEEHLQSEGRDPGSVAYLPHFQAQAGANFHTKFDIDTRPNLGKTATTGEAYRRGFAPRATADLLRSQGARQATQLNKAEMIDRSIADWGRRHPAWAKHLRGDELSAHEREVVNAGGYFTAKEAARLARNLERDTSHNAERVILTMPNGDKMVAVRAYAAKLDSASQEIIRENLQGPTGMDSLGQRLLHDRFLTRADLEDDAATPALKQKRVVDRGARNVVLVPKSYVDQLQAQLRPAGAIQRTFQMLNRPFRMAVLAQPRWLTGNFIEPYFIRLTAEGSGLNVYGLAQDFRAFNKTMKLMRNHADPKVRQAAKEIEAQAFGGLLSSKGGSVRRTPIEALPPGLQQTYADIIAKHPAVDTMGKWSGVVGHYATGPARGIFWLNRYIEGGAQRAAFGRLVRRELEDFTQSWVGAQRMADAALEDVAKGLVNTGSQRRFMEATHKMLGKYDGYGPTMRAATQTALPFLPWVLNAVRFIGWTMPVEKSALTALLQQASGTVSQAWKDDHASLPPGSLRYAIKQADGGLVDVARYTPYGIGAQVSEGDLSGFTGNVLPQLRGAVEALQGRDPFGRDLKVKPTATNPKGTPNLGDKLGIAGYGLAEATTPYLALARRLREHGGTGYANSRLLSEKVKPNSETSSAARRVLDPFRPTYLKGKTSLAAAPAGGSSSSGDSGVSGISDAELDKLDDALYDTQGAGMSDEQLDAIDERIYGGG